MRARVFTLLAFSLFLRQAAANSIAGTVTDPAGRPVSGATIYLASGDEATQVTVSGDDGSYRFCDLPERDYRISAWAGGLGSQAAAVEVCDGSSLEQPCVLSEAAEFREFVVKLNALSDASARQLSFKVSPGNDDAQSLLMSATIASQLSSLPSGDYEVVATVSGSAYIGTMTVATGLVRHSSGIVISSEDFAQALHEEPKNRDLTEFAGF